MSAKEGCYLIGVSWLRYDSEFFGDVVEGDAQNYLVLIVSIQKSERHLDNEILVSTNYVARNIDFRRKKFAQVAIVRWFRRADIHLFCPCFSLNMH